MITYTLVRSKRKTVAIHITKDAEVIIRAPLKTPKTEDIDKIVKSKEAWIEKHLVERQRINEVKAVHSLDYGDTALLCGSLYPVCAKDGKRVGFDGECFFVPHGLTPDVIKKTVIQIYKSEAKRIFNEKVGEYAQLMNVSPTAMRITSAKTR